MLKHRDAELITNSSWRWIKMIVDDPPPSQKRKKITSSFTHPNVFFFLLQNTYEDILKNVGSKQLPIDFHSKTKKQPLFKIFVFHKIKKVIQILEQHLMINDDRII